MSYAAPYPNCSTQYSKSFPLLTTRTHTPNRPSHYYEIHCPTPVDSMSSATRGGGSRTALPSPVVLADAGTHPTPLLSSRMRGPIPPPVVLADAGTHPTPRCPRGCGDPSHPPLSSRMRGPIPPLLPSRMRGPSPPLSVVLADAGNPPSLEDAPLLSAHVLTVIPSPAIPTEAGTHPFPHPICAIPNPLI